MNQQVNQNNEEPVITPAATGIADNMLGAKPAPAPEGAKPNINQIDKDLMTNINKSLEDAPDWDPMALGLGGSRAG